MPPTTAGGSALVALCTIWAFIYANSLAPIGWISLVECSTPQLRAKTAAFAAVIQACSGILFVSLPVGHGKLARTTIELNLHVANAALELHRPLDAE